MRLRTFELYIYSLVLLCGLALYITIRHRYNLTFAFFVMNIILNLGGSIKGGENFARLFLLSGLCS